MFEQSELRPAVTQLVLSARQFHEESCSLLREKAQNLVRKLYSIFSIEPAPQNSKFLNGVKI